MDRRPLWCLVLLEQSSVKATGRMSALSKQKFTSRRVVGALRTLLGRLARAYGWYFALQFVTRFVRRVVSTIVKVRKLKQQNVYQSPCCPILGHVREVKENFDRLLDFRLDAIKESKAKTVLRLGLVCSDRIQMLTTDPIVVKYILKDNFRNWDKPSGNENFFFKYFRAWLGVGIFTLHHSNKYGEYDTWKLQRKLASSIFTKNNFRTYMYDVFQERASTLVDHMRCGARAAAAAHEVYEIDMQQKLFGYTMDSIMRIFFSQKTETVTGENEGFPSAFDEAHRAHFELIVKNVGLLTLAKLLPWPFGPLSGSNVTTGIIPWCIMTLSPLGSRFKRAITRIREETRKVIENKLEDPATATSNDLLSYFLRARDDDGVPFSDAKYTEFLSGVVRSMVIAGRDTTACLMSWTFFMLTAHPDIQNRLYEEIMTNIGDGEPRFDLLAAQQMPYLNGVVYETLRLHPPVPVDPKTCIEEDTLPDGTRVPAGTTIMYFPWGMGRDPAVYEDPLAMKPERWIPFKEPDLYKFPVFQAGSRQCLGMNMAIYEAKLVIVNLIRAFKFTLKPGEEENITYSPMITMSIKNGSGSYKLLLHAEERQPQGLRHRSTEA